MENYTIQHMKKKQGEYRKKDLATKEVFFYASERDGYDAKVREVYKNKPLEIHFPFNPTSGGQKYKYIQSIEFHNISPKTINGVYKSVERGYGLTRNLSPIILTLEKHPSIKKIIITSRAPSSMDRTSITFNIHDLGKIFQKISPFRKKQNKDLKNISNNTLSDVFPTEIKKELKTYTEGEIIAFFDGRRIRPKDISGADIEKIVDMIPENIKRDVVVYQAEEKINHIKLEKTRTDFEKIINQKNDSNHLEKKCQDFFKNNHWILSNILSMPVVFLKEKAYVGGKEYNNTGGKEADFLFRNNLTKNIFIIEIKTPLKKIVEMKPYRGSDVFNIGKEVVGGLIQALDQKDNLQKEFYKLAQNSDFKSFNPRVVLIVGKIQGLTEKEMKSFDLFRNSIKDVEIITYDELFEKTKLILGEFIETKNIEQG